MKRFDNLEQLMSFDELGAAGGFPNEVEIEPSSYFYQYFYAHEPKTLLFINFFTQNYNIGF